MAAIYDAELEAALTELTHKQELFCREYFVSLNATQAARDAGYKGNDVTLASVGYENLIKPQIVKATDLFFERKANDIDINAGVIEREYWKLFTVCMNEGNRAVARSCLKDLGEHHAMFIKVVASAEASELALRLASGRSRMNDAREQREQGAEPGPVAVGASPAAL
jgi:phage terminase small subunit